MLLDGLSVITDQARAVFGILLLIALSQILLGSLLRIIFDSQLTTNEYFALSLAGWILPASLLSALWLLFGFLFTIILTIVLIIVLILFHLRFKTDPQPDSKTTYIFLLCFLSISCLLRLVFVSRVVLPSYFDSAQHYRLIKNITGNNLTAIFASARYYHMGFHFLTAFTTSILHTEIAKTMLIMGQLMLAIMPVSVFFLISHETKSNAAGVLAVILAAFGWYMPAHAVDWGKYPALTSLALIPFVLSLAYLLAQNKLAPRRRFTLYILLAAGILASGFIHSRSMVIFGITFIAWIIATWQQKLPPLPKSILFFMTLIVITLEIITIQKQEILTLLFDPYFQKGMLITILVLFLTLFALKDFSQILFACLFAISLLLGSLFIPVTGLIPGYDNLTLLDRPYVEMILYLPLSLLGGLGLAGLEKSLQQTQIKLISRNGFVGLLAGGLVLLYAVNSYNLYPSSCCMLAGNEDIVAMDWMNTKLPPDARIGVSATVLKVLTTESLEGYVGGDAGIWITPLINRTTTPLLFDLDFGQQATLDMLCKTKVNYLYVGEMGQTFDDSMLSNQPERYKILFSMSGTRVYQVIGCK